MTQIDDCKHFGEVYVDLWLACNCDAFTTYVFSQQSCPFSKITVSSLFVGRPEILLTLATMHVGLSQANTAKHIEGKINPELVTLFHVATHQGIGIEMLELE